MEICSSRCPLVVSLQQLQRFGSALSLVVMASRHLSRCPTCCAQRKPWWDRESSITLRGVMKTPAANRLHQRPRTEGFIARNIVTNYFEPQKKNPWLLL